MAGKSEGPREIWKTVRNSKTHTSRKRQGNTKERRGQTEEAVKVQRQDRDIKRIAGIQ